MSQVLHECPPVTLVVQYHMSAHFNARLHKKICISIAFHHCLIFFNFHDSQIHHRTLKLHRCLIIKALHQSTNTPTLSVRNASNMCALSSRVQAKNLCKGRREDHPGTHPLARMCSHTYQHRCTLPTLHVAVHTLPTHLLLATLIAAQSLQYLATRSISVGFKFAFCQGNYIIGPL